MSAAPARAADLVGQTLIGKLRVKRVLGAGGMGTVFEVEHLITRHTRALKVLHAQHGQSHETVARFIREAGVAGTLRTPYVVETYDAGTLDDGAAYVLMELLHGMPLASLLEGAQPVAPGRVVGIACQLLEGLSVAHEAGIVHRDIKPDNVFLVRDEQGRERVKILDFGISKFTRPSEPSHGPADYVGTLTSEGTMMGTPYYMSPEQASGVKDVDARTDLYSIGVMLYEGLAGVRPFDGQTLAALVIRIHKGECVPLETIAPHLPPGLAAVVQRAMSPDRDDRFRSAREMLAELVPFADTSYVASLDTLREVVAEAVTLRHPSMPAPEGVARAASARQSEVERETIGASLGAITVEAVEDARRPRRGDRRVALAAAALALAIGAGGALAWAMRAPSGETAAPSVPADAPRDPGVREAPPAADAPGSADLPPATAAAPPAAQPPDEPPGAVDGAPDRNRPRAGRRGARAPQGDEDVEERGAGAATGRTRRTIDRDNPF